MKFPKTFLSFLRLGGLVFALGAGAPSILAATPVPSVIKLVVPYPPGGSTDQLARQVASALGQRLKTTVIVENRPGAGSVLGTDTVAKAKPDGATLLLTTSALSITAALRRQMPYDPVTDLVPLAILTEVPLVLAVPTISSYRSMNDLIADARARPGALNYGSSGVGSSNHMAAEWFASAAKIKLTHVPYKGMSPATVDLAGGQVQLILATYSSLSSVLQGDKVRALAITAPQPSASLPGIPTVAATVPGFSMSIWFGVFAPRRTPADLAALFSTELRAIRASPELAAFLSGEKAGPSGMDSVASSALIRTEVQEFRRIASEQKIEIE